MTNQSPSDQPYDVAIIGGNFAGMAAALYLLRARRRVVMFDDGQHRNRFAAHSHGFLGQDGASPDQIRATGLAELRRYPTFQLREERVGDVSGVVGDFAVTGNGGTTYAKRVILATGQRDLLPDVPGLAECWGKTANTCPYCHGYELADLPTGILLDDNPHAGMYLRQVRRWAGALTVFDNGAALDPQTVALIAELGAAYVPGPLAGLQHEAGILHSIAVTGGAVVPLRALYLGTKTTPAAPFAGLMGCEMAESHSGLMVSVDTWQRSTVPGVFVAGDLARGMPAAIFAAASGASAGIGCDMDLAGLLT